MTLGELIQALEAIPPDTIAPVGFLRPHSYRGFYQDLAFEPRENVAFRDMLEAAKGALGQTFQGYKGGDYEMFAFTECWLARYGETGEGIGPALIRYMAGNPALEGGSRG